MGGGKGRERLGEGRKLLEFQLPKGEEEKDEFIIGSQKSTLCLSVSVCI